MNLSKLSRGWPLLCVLVLIAGCRSAPETTSYVVPELPVVAAPPPTLLPISAMRIEPRRDDLPSLDVAVIFQPQADEAAWKGLSIEQCRDGVISQTRACWATAETEWERHLADATCSKAVATSLQHYYDLAEAIAQHEILTESLPLIQQLADARQRAEEYGLAVPITAEQLERQRLQLHETMLKADTAAKVLNINLKQALGLPSNNDQLRPTVDLSVPTDVDYDEAALIEQALSNRSDLLALRSLYLSMNVETVPSVEGLLREQFPILARLPKSASKDEENGPTAEALLHFAKLRAALHQRILDHEREVADEVRSAIENLKLKHQAVAIARFNVDRQIETIEAKSGQGPLLELPAKLTAIELRTKLMYAVCDWHRANVQLQSTTY